MKSSSLPAICLGAGGSLAGDGASRGVRLPRLEGDHLPPLLVQDPQDRFAQLPGRQVLRTFQDERLAGRQVGVPFGVAVGAFQADRGPGQRRGDADADPHPVLGQFHAHRRIEIGVLRRADLLDRIPVLTPGLRLAGLQEGEIGLIVGIDSRHQLDVWAVAVGEIAVPGVAELVVAPGPLLLAGGDVMVGHDGPCRPGGSDRSRRRSPPAEPRHMYDVGTGMFAYHERSLGGYRHRRRTAAMRRDEIGRTLAGRHAVAGPLRRNRLRSRSPRKADSGSWPAWRDRPHNRRRAERTTGSPRGLARPRWPTRGTSAPAACDCRPAPSIRSRPCPDAGRRRACLSCGPSGRGR